MKTLPDDDTLVLEGGKPLEGHVVVRGSKNAVPKLMVGALLCDEPIAIHNVSFVRDISIVADLVEALGCTTGRWRDEGRVRIDASRIEEIGGETMAEFHAASRIPILACAPLLHRLGRAAIARPGGCEIGDRPIDLHLDVLRKLGAHVDENAAGLVLTNPDGLHGAKIALRYPSVGATEQFLLAAVLAEGDSELQNAAIEPEIGDLVSMLQQMGGIISVLPGRIIRVTGVRSLHAAEYSAIPDRLEAASWASLALATGGRITVSGVRQGDLQTFLNVYRRAGGEFSFTPDGTTVTFWRERSMLRPLAIETDVHPGFMTDWQPPLLTALTQANGVTVLHETVYENRLGYSDALNALGAHVQTFRECLGPTPCRFGSLNYRHSAVVVGPAELHGAHLHVPDLRAGFSYVVGALAASGESRITGAAILDRGYESFRAKLESVNAKLK